MDGALRARIGPRSHATKVTVLETQSDGRVCGCQKQRVPESTHFSGRLVAFVANAIRRHWTVCELRYVHQSWRWVETASTRQE